MYDFHKYVQHLDDIKHLKVSNGSGRSSRCRNCRYFIVLTVAVLFCCHGNANSATLAYILLHIQLLLPPLETGESNTFKH
jgi:hypothetical protein